MVQWPTFEETFNLPGPNTVTAQSIKTLLFWEGHDRYYRELPESASRNRTKGVLFRTKIFKRPYFEERLYVNYIIRYRQLLENGLSLFLVLTGGPIDFIDILERRESVT